MRTMFLGMLAVVGLAVGEVEAKAQVGAPALNVTPKTNNNPLNPPPAGQKLVYAEGTFTLGAGQNPDKVIVKWYKQAGNDLIYVGQTDDLAPANGKYKTSEIGVDIAAGGQNLKYSGIAELYIVGNNNSVATSAFANYTP